NPIDVARAVLDDGRHVLVVAEGAALAAKRAGIEPVGDPSSLITEKARLALGKPAGSGWAGGTIGAVARDKAGHVAAATSTGGTVGKLVGRVGDSPIIGAGTLADDTSCALSATGDGEGILKIGLARAIAFSIEAGESAEAAAKRWLEKMEARTEATGGVIIYEPNGRATWARCTETMSWAYAAEGGEASGA
ncbi:MAG: isoaspartyl peptidase/L-asparaginase, partial [Myxococcales bacterium]|nr:isoaspartyl peptidase/L-asparaginase [Myxococcales bacterium]